VLGSNTFFNCSTKKRKDTEILLQVPDPKIMGEEMAAKLMSQVGKNSLKWIIVKLQLKNWEKRIENTDGTPNSTIWYSSHNCRSIWKFIHPSRIIKITAI
jgi:hypothetical protein